MWGYYNVNSYVPILVTSRRRNLERASMGGGVGMIYIRMGTYIGMGEGGFPPNWYELHRII